MIIVFKFKQASCPNKNYNLVSNEDEVRKIGKYIKELSYIKLIGVHCGRAIMIFFLTSIIETNDLPYIGI